jgi:hypothetical protein
VEARVVVIAVILSSAINILEAGRRCHDETGTRYDRCLPCEQPVKVKLAADPAGQSTQVNYSVIPVMLISESFN